MNKRKKIIKRIVLIFAFGFILMNIIAFFHAYKFTHFATENVAKYKNEWIKDVSEFLMISKKE